MEFDEIIVGAGSSGAVLAARLSEDGRRNVLLIEAGPDYPAIESTPESVLNGRQMPADHDWGFTAEMVPGRSVAYARGKVIGGCSSVNACVALRGTPDDYDEWGALGNADWDWAKVLPAFKRLEDDRDVHDDFHGVDGPIPVRRYMPAELCPASRAFVEACRGLGFSATHDHNHPEATGVGLGPWNIRDDHVRVSTAIGYLTSARRRPNLSIRSNCLVSRALFDGNRAIGVELENMAGREQIIGRRVTLSAGAVGSPAILLRSGIGPADHLKAVGIEPKRHLPGVGSNLVDHPNVGMSWDAPPGVVDADAPLCQVLLRCTAPGSRLENDMQAILTQGLRQPAIRLRTMVMKPHSRGFLTLRSSDPREQPDIRLNLASEAEDARRLAECVRLMGRLVPTPALDAVGARTVTLDDGETMSAGRFADLLEDADWIDGYVRRVVTHYVHPVGTARMGPADDAEAVVDQHGRVRGFGGLRVADASIMPTIPRANTNLTCVMIGERLAAWMREEED